MPLDDMTILLAPLRRRWALQIRRACFAVLVDRYHEAQAIALFQARRDERQKRSANSRALSKIRTQHPGGLFMHLHETGQKVRGALVAMVVRTDPYVFAQAPDERFMIPEKCFNHVASVVAPAGL